MLNRVAASFQTNRVFLGRRDPIVLSVEEVIQEEQEGCIRMSRKMKEFCSKELRGEIPGLKGDTHFGARVTEDLNRSAIVERVAQDQHCKSCKHCSAANAIQLHGSAAEGGQSWWLRRSLEMQDQEEEAKEQEQETQEQEQEAQEPEEQNEEEQDSWWLRMSLDKHLNEEAWLGRQEAFEAKRREHDAQEAQEVQEQEEHLEHSEIEESEEEQEQMEQ